MFPPTSKKIRFLFPLVEIILLMSTIILQEEISIELNLSELHFSREGNLATYRLMACLSVKSTCQHLQGTSVIYILIGIPEIV